MEKIEVKLPEYPSDISEKIRQHFHVFADENTEKNEAQEEDDQARGESATNVAENENDNKQSQKI